MDFYKGKPLEVKASFNGTRAEAYTRACHLATGLADLLKDRKFTVRVDRTDAPATGYEIGPDGHTIIDACSHHQQGLNSYQERFKYDNKNKHN